MNWLRSGEENDVSLKIGEPEKIVSIHTAIMRIVGMLRGRYKSGRLLVCGSTAARFRAHPALNFPQFDPPYKGNRQSYVRSD